MKSSANSTIAALCYATPSDLDFTVLAAELEDALRAHPMLAPRVTSQYEDFVIFDMAGLRICLAFSDLRKDFPQAEPPNRYREALVISVGHHPDPAGESPLSAWHDEIFEGLIERVTAQHPAQQCLSIELGEIFTEEIYDSVLDCFWLMLGADTSEAETDPAAPRAAVDHAAQAQGKSEENVPDTPSCTHIPAPQTHPEGPYLAYPVRPTHPALAADRAGLRAMREKPLAPPPASVPPPGPNAARDENSRLRMALYPPEPEPAAGTGHHPLLHRAAIHTMNTSVIAFSLPLGAVVLTYSLLGRESLNFTARIAALTGSVMGTSQSELGAQILSAFA